MPGEAARSPDGDALFAAPVLDWLQASGCRGVHRLDGLPGAASPAWITAPVGPHGSDETGWRFGWRDDDGRDHAVLLAFAGPDTLSEDARTAIAGYLALAGRCAGVGTGAAVLADRDAVSRRLHDLRNALNSLLMNVAVLTTKLPPADREGRFAVQAQADGERCATLMQALADTIRPPASPPR